MTDKEQRPGSAQLATLAETSAGRTVEEVLREHKLWEGWGQYYDAIPLGPGQELQLPSKKEENDPEVVGFAFPLAPVAYAHRNERRFPPPSAQKMYKEIFKLLHQLQLFKRSTVLPIVYNHIHRNRRDSPGWQGALIEAGGIPKLFDIWHNPEERAEEESLTDRYWVMAIFGRMMGTCTESRIKLIDENAVDLVLEGTKDTCEDVRECSICALKGLIAHPEGRKVVTYSTLIECLGGRM